MPTAALAGVLLTAALPAAALLETNNDLDLRLRVVEAVENGPVVFVVSLTNRGPRGLPVEWFGDHECHLAFPEGWPDFPRLPCGGFGSGRRARLEPGQTWTVRLAPHILWVGRFPAGTASVTVSWPLYYPSGDDEEGGRRLAADPVKTFPVTLAPATPANLAALARRSRAAIDALPAARPGGDTDLRADDLRAFKATADRVLFTTHKELLPVALALLDRCPTGAKRFQDETYGLRRNLVETVFGTDPAAGNTLFIGRLTGKVPVADPAAVFGVWGDARYRVFAPTRWEFWHERFWQSGRTLPLSVHVNHVLTQLAHSLLAAPRLLPADDLRRLAAADDFWVRALTFATFADRLDPAWKEWFLRDLRGRWAGPPPEVARQLLRDLDDPRFAIRDAADRRLRGFGHAVAPALQAALKAGPSAEVRQRAEAILATLDGEPLDRRAGLALESLYSQPGAARLLDALAAGPDTDPVVKAARERRKELAR